MIQTLISWTGLCPVCPGLFLCLCGSCLCYCLGLFLCLLDDDLYIQRRGVQALEYKYIISLIWEEQYITLHTVQEIWICCGSACVHGIGAVCVLCQEILSDHDPWSENDCAYETPAPSLRCPGPSYQMSHPPSGKREKEGLIVDQVCWCFTPRLRKRKINWLASYALTF